MINRNSYNESLQFRCYQAESFIYYNNKLFLFKTILNNKIISYVCADK